MPRHVDVLLQMLDDISRTRLDCLPLSSQSTVSGIMCDGIWDPLATMSGRALDGVLN